MAKAKAKTKVKRPVHKKSLKAKKVKKSVSKKSPKKKSSVKKPIVVKATPIVTEQPIGKVTHFYDQIKVAVVALNSTLKVGDKIKIGRDNVFFTQEVKSMQIEHESINTAKKGQEIGLKVNREAKEGCLVFKA